MCVAARIIAMLRLQTIDHDESASWYKCTKHVTEDYFPVLEFVVGVNDEHCIHCLGGEPWIATIAANYRDVMPVGQQCPGLKESKRKSANVYREYSTLALDRLREFQREVSGTTPQISHYIPRPQVQGSNHSCRALPSVSFSLDSIQIHEGADTAIDRRETDNAGYGDGQKHRNAHANRTHGDAARSRVEFSHRITDIPLA